MTIFDRKEAERQAMARIQAQDDAVNAPYQQAAMTQLKALLNVPGALKIITNMHNPKAPSGLLPQHPHFWEAHEVVRIEGPDHNGNVWAYSKEGDICKGHAHALLGRLTQFDRAAEFSEERVEAGSSRRSARAAAGHAEVAPSEPLKAE